MDMIHSNQFVEHLYNPFLLHASEGFISDITDKILPQIEEWQNCPLVEINPIVYIDTIHYSVRDNGIIKKLAAYVSPGLNTEEKSTWSPG